jgi:osmoprotectant transport system substrate-binding protein
MLLIASVAAGCGDDEEPLPPIRAAGFNFPESHVLGWIFALAFEDAGFEVETSAIQPGNTREILKPALEEGEIDFLPEYIGTLLGVLGGEPTNDSEATYAAARDLYAEEGVALLPYAAAQDKNAFVVTREFARERGISTLSDLAPIADELRFGAPPECPGRMFCLVGLREVYGIEFGEFIPMDAQARSTALTQGTVDVVELFTTDAPLAANEGEWVVLDDDRGLLAAENVALAIRQTVVDAYGDGLTSAVAGISERLTTEELSELNRRVQLDGVGAEDAAREWLVAQGLID